MAINKTVNIFKPNGRDFNINMAEEEEPVTNKTLNWLPVASCFQGRQDIFANIQQMFETNRLVVVHGMPGIGKTETARHFGTNNREHYDGNLVWIYAETPENIKKCFGDLAKILKLEIPDAFQIFDKFQTSKALFIFDNAENMAAIKEYLPSKQLHPNVDVLITSQFGDWDSTISKVPLFCLNKNDALNIFKAKSENNFHKYPINIWENLVDELEGIPLSLQIVSSIIKQKIRLSSFNLAEFIPNLMETFIDTSISKSEQNYYNKSVLAAIYTALSRLEEEEKEDTDLCCLDILSAIACFKTDFLYNDVLLEIPSIKKSRDLLELALNKLEDYSLIQLVKNSFPTLIKVHRTIQFVSRDYNLKKRNGDIFKTVLSLLVSGKLSWHEDSILRYANKEFLGKSREFYNENHENESLIQGYVKYLIRYNCDEVLQIILPNFMNGRIDKFIEMLFIALYFESDLKTIQVFLKSVAQNEEGVHQIKTLPEWRSTKVIDILLESNIFRNEENDSKDKIKLKDSVTSRFLHLHVRMSNKENVRETIECMNHLVSNWGADILYQDDDLNNILHIACCNMEISSEIIECLFQLENGKLKGIVDCQNKKTETPLHVLFLWNRNNPDIFEIFRYFITKFQADITIQNNYRENVLFYVCLFGSFEMIEFILRERDCSRIINNQNEDGDVAFCRLFRNRLIKEADKIELFNSFLKYGMDINLKNKKKKTLLEIAEERGLNYLTEIIKNY